MGRWGQMAVTVVTVVLLVAAPVVVPFFDPWSGINRRVEEVDVMSGRVRISRYVYWVRVGEEIRETGVSGALAGRVAGVAPRWERVNAFGPYVRHSPHYRYHAALGQMAALAKLWEAEGAGAARREETARGLLKAWQSGDSDGEAGRYLEGMAAAGVGE